MKARSAVGMSESLNLSDPGTPPIASCDEALLKALTFARETATAEIDSIDRLHKRTLLALTIPLGAFGLLFTVVGWMGYSNLRRVAVNTSTEIVKQRLDDQLTRKNIDASVSSALREHAATQIKEAVADQVSKQTPQLQILMREMTSKAINEMRPQIVASARTEAQELLKETFTPRTLDDARANALTNCVRRVANMPITVSVGGDPEAQGYERQIADALIKGGWRGDEGVLLGAHRSLPRYGLAVVTSPELKDGDGARRIQQCLREARLNAPLVLETSQNSELSHQTTLAVLPKPK